MRKRRRRVTGLRRNPLSGKSVEALCKDGIIVRRIKEMRKNPSKFTRQDFQFIADVIREMAPSETAVRTRNQVALAFANALTRTNPNFNRSRFLKAAGVVDDFYMKSNPRRRARKNPPLAVFANPGRGMDTLSHNAVEIRYQHAGDGKYYKHSFKRGQVCIKARAGAKHCVLVRKDGKPIISEY